MISAGDLARACRKSPGHSLKQTGGRPEIEGDEHVRDDVRLRVMQAAEHILETGATVRACAGKFGVSKTTIHKDMRSRLPELDMELGAEVDRILKKNLRERHIRGGDATRRKFLQLRREE